EVDQQAPCKGPARQMPAAVIRAIEAIEASYTDNLSLHALAQIAGCSKWRLSRQFRAATEFGVVEFRTRLRLMEARRRLCAANMPLSQLAVELGFAHHSHFTAAFRKMFGMSPSKMRASVENEAPIISPASAGGSPCFYAPMPAPANR